MKRYSPRISSFALLALALLPLFLDSCSGTQKGLPKTLPNITLAGSPMTPHHTMQSFEYPFDSTGNYVAEWAAEGERRAGRPATATDDDEKKWGGSHGGKVTTTGKSKKKSAADSGKKTAPKSSDKPESKTTKKTPGKSGSGGSRHVVKSSDTLAGIARKYGTTVAKLKAANGLKSDVIRDGATLRIP